VRHPDLEHRASQAMTRRSPETRANLDQRPSEEKQQEPFETSEREKRARKRHTGARSASNPIFNLPRVLTHTNWRSRLNHPAMASHALVARENFFGRFYDVTPGRLGRCGNISGGKGSSEKGGPGCWPISRRHEGKGTRKIGSLGQE
jgi:hypothetical protein